jgi:hypothetical protein
MFMMIDNVFTKDEIKKLQICSDAQPITSITENFGQQYAYLDQPGLYIKNKQIAYQHNLSPFRKIIKPKIDAHIGTDHVVDTSAYKEYNVSYCLHIDSFAWHKQVGEYQFSKGKVNHNKAVIIPLMDEPTCKTTIFDIVSDTQVDLTKPLPEDWLTSSNTLDVNDYDHMPKEHLKDLNKLPLIGEFEWKVGSMLVFDKCLLHCSPNFLHSNFDKKMIILFLE